MVPQFKIAQDLNHSSLISEYVEVAGVGLVCVSYVMSQLRVFLFGARDAASECDIFYLRVSLVCLQQQLNENFLLPPHSP